MSALSVSFNFGKTTNGKIYKLLITENYGSADISIVQCKKDESFISGVRLVTDVSFKTYADFETIVKNAIDSAKIVLKTLQAFNHDYYIGANSKNVLNEIMAWAYDNL